MTRQRADLERWQDSSETAAMASKTEIAAAVAFVFTSYNREPNEMHLEAWYMMLGQYPQSEVAAAVRRVVEASETLPPVGQPEHDQHGAGFHADRGAGQGIQAGQPRGNRRRGERVREQAGAEAERKVIKLPEPTKKLEWVDLFERYWDFYKPNNGWKKRCANASSGLSQRVKLKVKVRKKKECKIWNECARTQKAILMVRLWRLKTQQSGTWKRKCVSVAANSRKRFRRKLAKKQRKGYGRITQASLKLMLFD
jgi:hypothetical protein